MRHQNEPRGFESGWENPDHHEPMAARPRPMIDPGDPVVLTPVVDMVPVSASAVAALWEFVETLRHATVADDPRKLAERLEEILNDC